MILVATFYIFAILKKQYFDLIEKYKEDIHHVVKIKTLLNELNPQSLIHFMNEYSSLEFKKIEEK